MIKNKSKWIATMSIGSLLIPISVISCSPSQFSGFDENGKPLPLNAESLKNYLDFRINIEGVQNTTATVALQQINSAEDEYKLLFLRSFLIPINNILTKNFNYQITAKRDSNNENSIIVEIIASDRRGGSSLTKQFKIDNFKPEIDISDADYQQIYDNLLEVDDMRFLTSKITEEQLTESDKDNRARYIRYTTSIMAKYYENLLPNQPLANLHYGGFFNGGKYSAEAQAKAKQGDFSLQTKESKEREIKALENARDLAYRKEKQRVKDSETDKTIENGWQNSNLARAALQKIIFLAGALRANVSDNHWYQSPELKREIKAILDDFTTKYYYVGQQQFVNWWFYEIGMPKDLVRVLTALQGQFPDSDLERWTAPIKYFMPNARFGGSSPTAINGFVPVIKKRLQDGANLIDNAKPILVSAALFKDANTLRDAILSMYDNIFREFASKGDGFYRDGSFVQHTYLPYVGSYGEVFFTGLADIVQYFQNTSLSIARDPRFVKLYRFIETAVMPYMFKMSISDGLSGRAISRPNHSDKLKGMNILGSLVVFAQEAPEIYKSRLYNFIYDQVSSFSTNEIQEIGRKYGVRSSAISSLQAIRKSNKMPTFDRNLDWEFYETNYFDKFSEPSNLPIQTVPTKPTVPGGVDLAIENNGLVFSKNQDRYVWKQKDFMFNINLRGRRIGMSEATLGENLESYYHADGATLLHTAKNFDPFSNEHWTAIDAVEIPGTSSIKNNAFDFIYNYRLPDASEKDWSDKEKAENRKWNSELANKLKKIEDNVSLKLNGSFSNGIIFEQMGMVKTRIFNYDRSLKTQKIYLMIDDMIIVLGNVNRKNKTVITTIENRLNKDAKRNLDGTWENLDKQNFSKQKLGKKDFFVLSNEINKEQNGYVILGSNSAVASKNQIEKYPKISGNGRDANLIYRSFDKLNINHEKDQTFAYAIIPNYDVAKKDKYRQILDNIEIISNETEAIVVKYQKTINNQDENYYFVNSFLEEKQNLSKFSEDGDKIESDTYYDEIFARGIDIPDLKLNLKIGSPTSMIFKEISGFTDLDIISSSDLNLPKYQFSLNRKYSTIESRRITNDNKVFPVVNQKPEATMVTSVKRTTILIDNTLSEFNDYNHNAWLRLNDYYE